jgi:hypothetical protein
MGIDVIRVVSMIEADCRECAFWTPGPLSRARAYRNIRSKGSQSHWVGRLHREGGTCQQTKQLTCVSCGCEAFQALSAHEKAERMVSHGA